MIESFKLPNITPETLTGSIVSFNDEYGNLPLKSCTSLISGYQEGSGTPSPDNVRPLHAFSSADLYFNTINQWDEVAEVGTIDTTTGKNTPNASRLRSTNYILVVPNTTYYIKMPTANNEYILWYEYDSNKNFIRYLYKSNGTTVTTTSNTRFIRFSTVDYGTTYNNDISINYPATDTSYHAFSGAVFTFGQSIYQGSIDWKRGVIVATWGYIASYNGETLTGEWLCNKAPYEAGTTPPTGSQVAYELATPIEIPLGGINLLTQEGQNNIFADCGDTEVKRLKVN